MKITKYVIMTKGKKPRFVVWNKSDGYSHISADPYDADFYGGRDVAIADSVTWGKKHKKKLIVCEVRISTGKVVTQ